MLQDITKERGAFLMSMADNIKKGISKRKNAFSSEEEVRDLFNAATSRTLKKFLQRLDTGEIPMDNVSDLVRLLGAYKEMNGISDAMESGGGGALPEVNLKQDKVLTDSVQDGKITSDDEGQLDVIDLSNEDVSDLLKKMDQAQNAENEGSF
jgi:hypothetical protein